LCKALPHLPYWFEDLYPLSGSLLSLLARASYSRIG